MFYFNLPSIITVHGFVCFDFENMHLLKFRQLYLLGRLAHSKASTERDVQQPVQKIAFYGIGAQSHHYVGQYHRKCDEAYLNFLTRTFQNIFSVINMYKIYLNSQFKKCKNLNKKYTFRRTIYLCD
jgi:hypothetical protein